MKDEIKETMKEMLEWLNRIIKENKESDVSLNGCVVPFETLYKLQDYITNLRAIEQQYSAILSENAELENKITNLQEELKSANESITWWSNRFNALQKENERLKEIVENLTTMTVCGDRKQIKNTSQYKLDIYKSRNEKAIEDIDLVIELIKQQPTEDDSWILNKLNGFKYLLNGGDE